MKLTKKLLPWVVLFLTILLAVMILACSPSPNAAETTPVKDYVSSGLTLYESTGQRDTNENLIYRETDSTTDSHWFIDAIGTQEGVDEEGNSISLIWVTNDQTDKSGLIKQ